jgi:hypothetical protein
MMKLTASTASLPAILALSALAALPALPGNAQAAELTYFESTQGELPHEGLLTTLQLDLGTNQVHGSVSVRGTSHLDAVGDRDSFAFVVAAGQQLLGISVQMHDTVGDMYWGRWTLWHANSAQDMDGTDLDVPLQPLSTGEAGTASVSGVWGPGLYQLRNTNLSWWPPLAVADYRVDMVVREVVSSVPEPSTLATVCVGLALLAARRWRKGALR